MLDKLKAVFSAFVNKTLSDKKMENAIQDLNLLLISNDVAVETANQICKNIVDGFKGEEVGRLSSTKKLLFRTLEEVIANVLTPEKEVDMIEEIKKKMITINLM